MIHYYEGTVFNAHAKTLVNTVNCHGVMGAGIALEFKLRYPEMFKDYVEECNKKEIKIGKPKLYKHFDGVWILNFPTKNHWKWPSKIEYIELGLQYFVENYKKMHFQSIAFPKLGTSNGGLDWLEVKNIMEKYLSKVDIDVYICLDEKKEAEGIEKKMLEALNKSDQSLLTDTIKLTSTQAELIKVNTPIDRFWKVRKVKKIGSKTYEKLFNYFYKKAYLSENNKGNNNIDFQEQQQLSLF